MSDFVPMFPPEYLVPKDPRRRVRVGATVGDSDEYRIFGSLKDSGYILMGQGIKSVVADGTGYDLHTSDEIDFQNFMQDCLPVVVVLDDLKVWNTYDPHRRFRNVELLAQRNDIFRVYVARDLRQGIVNVFHLCDAFQPHAWLCMDGPSVLASAFPFVRQDHCIGQSGNFAGDIEMLRQSYNGPRARIIRRTR